MFFYLFFFACLPTKYLLAIDSSPGFSNESSKKNEISGYSDYRDRYAYLLDDEPLDISAELDSYEKSNQEQYGSNVKSSHTQYYDCSGCKMQTNPYQCRGCKSHCYTQNKYEKCFSVYDVGKIAGINYIAYKTRNILKGFFMGIALTVNTLNYCFGWVNCIFESVGGENVF